MQLFPLGRVRSTEEQSHLATTRDLNLFESRRLNSPGSNAAEETNFSFVTEFAQLPAFRAFAGDAWSADALRRI